MLSICKSAGVCLLVLCLVPCLLQAQDLLKLRQRHIYTVPLQPGELNLGVEWTAKQPGHTHTFAGSFIYSNFMAGSGHGFFFGFTDCAGIAARYGYRMRFETDKPNFEGFWHGPLLMYRGMIFSYPDYNSPGNSSSLFLNVLSAQYMLGGQHVFSSGITLGGFFGVGVRGKMASVQNDLFNSGYYNSYNVIGYPVGNTGNPQFFVMPSIHLNGSVGYAF